MTKSRIGRYLVGAALIAGLAGCESSARQDPLLVRGSTDDIVFAQVPIFRDRPVDESIRGSLELTDYAVALHNAGLLETLQRAGPYTVFAVPNAPLEAEQRATSGQLLATADHASLRRLMQYTIVPGRYTEARLRRMIAKRGGPIGLTTLGGHDVLTVSLEPDTQELLLGDPQGRINRLWLADVPQSNGVLYATQSLLVPEAPR
ncbi:fasciclin domain-containing protein [Lichenicoccus sp.]|uniref:fasciclin domain-containing protein n=1 Tax=Lichenicoccus sp. TaxID=2781899 RepID=UPI003D13FBDA